jgi:transposase
MDDERAPICPACGVTMAPSELSAFGACDGEWVCLECEETDRLEQG